MERIALLTKAASVFATEVGTTRSQVAAQSSTGEKSQVPQEIPSAKNNPMTSRLSGFYKKNIAARLEALFNKAPLSERSRDYFHNQGGLALNAADKMSENVIATLGLPFSVALNFQLNKQDVLIPMAVEEPSVVAAASNAARLVRNTGGFVGEAGPSIMTTQVQLFDVPEVAQAPEKIAAHKEQLLRTANAAIPNMVKRGGGCVDLEVRVLSEEEGMVVTHFYVDVGDAMGANLVDTVAEAVAPSVQDILGGNIGLRILSNLPIRRMVKVTCEVNAEDLGTETMSGQEHSDGIVAASRFAELDPFRAVTHNKGIMNGIDAVALPLGQDWRSIEAGAHGFAALSGQYKPLATWERTETGVRGTIEMPLAVGTVGGSTKAHDGIAAAFELVGTKTSQELSMVMAAAGLASNLAALKALAGEGIQKGHMRLHNRKHCGVKKTD